MIISIQDKIHSCTCPSILILFKSLPYHDYFHIKHDFIPLHSIYPFIANLFPHFQILNISILFSIIILCALIHLITIGILNKPYQHIVVFLLGVELLLNDFLLHFFQKWWLFVMNQVQSKI